VWFNYGSGQSKLIKKFYGYGGGYDNTIAVPNVSSYQVQATMGSYYYPEWNTYAPHEDHRDFSGQPSSSQQVNLLIPVNRP
jgi:hypothetical protein